MAHIAVIAPPFAGHLAPMQAIAAALTQRGHTVSFLGMADAGAMIGPGVPFVPVGARTHPAGTLHAIDARIGALPAGALGLLGMRAVLRDLAAATTMLCAEAPAVLRRIGATAILADQTEAAGGLIARHLTLPVVSVANALPINEARDVPPPFTDWPYNLAPDALRRNDAGYRVSRMLSGPLNRAIGRAAADWGLPGLATLADCLSPTTQISQMVAAFDFPRATLPPGFAYVGPLRLPAPPDTTPPDTTPPPGTPIAFATLGTLQGGRAPLFAAIAEACHRRDLPCLIAHGGRLSGAQIAALPGAPIARDWVNQRAVLRHASVAITHGGLNTVLDALAAGVPLIVVPLAFEQAAIGARVAYHRIGVVVPPRRNHAAMAAALHQALVAIATDPAYAMRAAAMARSIAASGGAGEAADIIDATLRHTM